MQVLKAVIAGVAGTISKTLFSQLSSLIENEQVSEPELLGTLITHQTGKKGEVSKSKEALTIGYTLHVLVGVLFVYCYNLLWRNKIGKPNMRYGLIFGTASGLIGASVWGAYIKLHDRPPKVSLDVFLRNMLINHILFGLTVAWIYRRYHKNTFLK